MASVLVVMLIGIASAGVLDYFGKISGEVVVSGPVFYATGEHIEGDIPTVIYGMSTNEIPDVDVITNLTNGYTMILTTDSLGVEYFYKPRFDMNIKAKSNNGIEGNDLFLEVWVLDEDYKYEYRICETKINIKAVSSFTNYDAYCKGDDELFLEETDRFGLKISGSGGDALYFIRAGFYDPDKMTHMRVTAQ